MAFLTDFRENPSTLSTDGGEVAAEDIALKRHGQNNITKRSTTSHKPFKSVRLANPKPRRYFHTFISITAELIISTGLFFSMHIIKQTKIIMTEGRVEPKMYKTPVFIGADRKGEEKTRTKNPNKSQVR